MRPARGQIANLAHPPADVPRLAGLRWAGVKNHQRRAGPPDGVHAPAVPGSG